MEKATLHRRSEPGFLSFSTYDIVRLSKQVDSPAAKPDQERATMIEPNIPNVDFSAPSRIPFRWRVVEAVVSLPEQLFGMCLMVYVWVWLLGYRRPRGVVERRQVELGYGRGSRREHSVEDRDNEQSHAHDCRSDHRWPRIATENDRLECYNSLEPDE